MQHIDHTSRRRRSRFAAIGLTAAMALPVVAPGLGAGASAAGREATIYQVTKEGMTIEDARSLAERTGTEPALASDGGFSFANPDTFGAVPEVFVGREESKDDDGEIVTSLAIDEKALADVKIIDHSEAKKLMRLALGLPEHYTVNKRVDHTVLEMSDLEGKELREIKLDTTVSYQIRLDGFPLVGPGAKMRASFDGQGKPTQMTYNMREVEPVGTIPIMSSADARRICVEHYGPEEKQGWPNLVYAAPPLTAVDASGKGTVEQLLPHYVCRPRSTGGDLAAKYVGILIPASPDFAPKARLEAESDGKVVRARVAFDGGSGPYTLSWVNSSGVVVRSTTHQNAGEHEIEYALGGDREHKADEQLNVLITDTNGVGTRAAVVLPAGGGTDAADGLLGGVGGAFAETGISQTVDEWQCAQDSANGFKSVMQANGQSVDFDWRGASAWERDFKDPAFGGIDSDYVDEVDMQWYTGHGWSGGFTFKGTNDDTSIVPSEARWGNLDLEWLNLESCQVLRDTNGQLDHLGRWDEVFDGLHMINGFHTNAYCISGGTGARFAEYLMGRQILFINLAPLSVRQAWAQMAIDLEPAGVRYRSMGPIRDDGVTNMGDFYWGKGSVGPDIPKSRQIGFWSISGVA